MLPLQLQLQSSAKLVREYQADRASTVTRLPPIEHSPCGRGQNTCQVGCELLGSAAEHGRIRRMDKFIAEGEGINAPGGTARVLKTIQQIADTESHYDDHNDCEHKTVLLHGVTERSG